MTSFLSRRAFIGQSAAALAGVYSASTAPFLRADEATPAKPGTRFIFLTDIHLMVGGALASEKGLAACLDAVEAVRPRPDFILCGGDLTQESPDLDYDAGGKLLERFLGIWRDHTSLPTHHAFGNHDFVGSKNPTAAHDDPRFGKGLWQQRLGLPHSFYSFDAGGWRFVVLDDVDLKADGSYTGEFPDAQLVFLKQELADAAGHPVVLCGHIPSVSALPAAAGLAKLAGAKLPNAAHEGNSSLVATNTKMLLSTVNEAHGNLKLVLAGHLHRYEQLDLEGIRYINSGAVCGNWWRGPLLGCPEGFLVVDLEPDGKFTHTYQPYGWDWIARQG